MRVYAINNLGDKAESYSTEHSRREIASVGCGWEKLQRKKEHINAFNQYELFVPPCAMLLGINKCGS